MSSTRKRASSTLPPGPHRLQSLPELPAGVREVVLSSTETLRLRVVGRTVECVLYRLRRQGEQGEPVRRFSGRRESLGRALAEVLGEAESRAGWQTVEWYIRALPWAEKIP